MNIADYEATRESIFGPSRQPYYPTLMPADPRDQLAELRYCKAHGIRVPWRLERAKLDNLVTRKQLLKLRRDLRDVARNLIQLENLVAENSNAIALLQRKGAR